jgi:hypothetical protein
MKKITISALLTLLIFSNITYAEDNNVKINETNKNLNARITSLEKRIEALENSKPKSGIIKKNAANASGSWRSLSNGMSKEQVINILGEPNRITSGSFGQIWYYPDSLGGTVNIDGSGQVTGWSEP